MLAPHHAAQQRMQAMHASKPLTLMPSVQRRMLQRVSTALVPWMPSAAPAPARDVPHVKPGLMTHTKVQPPRPNKQTCRAADSKAD